MSRISNDLADKIAVKLTEKSRLAMEKMSTDFRELATSIFESQIPEDVKKCFKINPEWFYTSREIKLEGHGFQWEYVSATRTVICNGGTKATIAMTAAIGQKLVNAKTKWQNAQKKYNLLREETKQALLVLRTFANIRKELPEASSMLPPPMSNALVCNFDSLKKQLAKQPEIEKTNVKA